MPAISLFMPTNDPETRDEAREWNIHCMGVMRRFPYVTPRTILKIAQEDYFGKITETNYLVCPHGHGVQTVEAYYERDCNAWDFYPEDDLYCRVCNGEMEDVEYAQMAFV